MIELNRKYSGKELAKELFDISDGTFRNSKQEYLDYMSEFYEWHQEKSKYVFTKVLKPYVPKVKGRKSTKNKISSDYEIAVYKLLSVEPWNTGAGIARDITFGNRYMQKTYHHKPRTAYNYVLPITKENYDITERKWKAYMDGGFSDMSDYELAEWKALLNACFGNRGDISMEQDLAIMKEAGDISDEDYKEMLAKINDNKYQAALDMWKKKYGYRPVRVNYYEVKEIGYTGGK